MNDTRHFATVVEGLRPTGGRSAIPRIARRDAAGRARYIGPGW